jgi:site-specific recombinase
MLKKDSFLRRLRRSKNLRIELDILASQAPLPSDSLRSRMMWLVELIQWIRLEGNVTHQFDFKSGEPQAARVKYLLLVLSRNPEWKSRVSHCLASIVLETQAVELLMNAGISERESFLGELVERTLRKILPQAPNDEDLAVFFSEYLKDPKDVAWISSIDADTFSEFLKLFRSPTNIQGNADDQHSILRDVKDALLLLSIQVRASGLTPAIRLRLDEKNFEQLPFFKLPIFVDQLCHSKDPEMQLAAADKVEKLIAGCFLSLEQVRLHLDEYGVNIAIVYSIAKLEAQLERVKILTFLMTRRSHEHRFIAAFITQLIAQNARRHSVVALLSDNFSLVSRKIAERSAETGEHYILRTLGEYRIYFRKAMGGGFITTFTTLFKYMSYVLYLPPFLAGILTSLNYSLSFLIIHFAGFTLGTKQPAMTAPALAAKMHKIRDEQALISLVDEIVHTVRSQALAVIGNVLAAVPTTYFICMTYLFATGQLFLSEEKALATMNSFSFLGMTPFFAAFTGILLWFSSLIAGWVDNWFAYRRISAALARNRRLIFIFGESRARQIGIFLKQNTSAIAGSISLGFLLGMTPIFAQFFSLPLDVRHVTLSSASLAAAAVSFPAEVFSSWSFWLALLGIASMGILNISVSFGMALFVAIRARAVEAPERGLIYRAVWKRFKQSPRSFFWPPKTMS